MQRFLRIKHEQKGGYTEFSKMNSNYSRGLSESPIDDLLSRIYLEIRGYMKFFADILEKSRIYQIFRGYIGKNRGYMKFFEDKMARIADQMTSIADEC
ncbi:hypothetical protein CVD23_04360 [Bacillus sp. V33-4]|nr:hypothetical protein CVD23_04360 [Bacillus sp. V33-4]